MSRIELLAAGPRPYSNIYNPMGAPPISSRHIGFIPLDTCKSPSSMESLPRRPSHSANDHIVNIPLSTVNSHCSSRTTGGSRREGQTMDSEYTHPPGENDGIFHGHIGRRRIVQDSSSTIGEDEGALTTMGKIYGKVSLGEFFKLVAGADFELGHGFLDC